MFKYLLAVIALQQLKKEAYQIKIKLNMAEWKHKTCYYLIAVYPCFATYNNLKNFIYQNNLTTPTR